MVVHLLADAEGLECSLTIYAAFTLVCSLEAYSCVTHLIKPPGNLSCRRALFSPSTYGTLKSHGLHFSEHSRGSPLGAGFHAKGMEMKKWHLVL